MGWGGVSSTDGHTGTHCFLFFCQDEVEEEQTTGDCHPLKQKKPLTFEHFIILILEVSSHQ